MSKAQQVKINIILSEKLSNYLIAKPDVLKKFSGYSYVIFSHTNQELNKLNYQLVDELIDEGKNVVKAEETGNLKQPWSFTPVYN
ncbi:MAG: hypothetical protein HYW86_04270 [Candidatus Roizmanbacteria bacterium]|nr:MAG: hypothetical protein HYW86_04270 [Candidatus Roizmanbacteria bacterium]